MMSRRALRSSTGSTSIQPSSTFHRNGEGDAEIQEPAAEGNDLADLDSGIGAVKKRKTNKGTAAARSKRSRAYTPETDEKAAKGVGKWSFNRPAEPHRTNAPVTTPQGSCVVAYPNDSLDRTTIPGIQRPITDTEHILEQACAHIIKMDPRMQPLIDKHYCRVFCPEGLAEECDPFKSLCSGIMAQQVSGAAASSIKSKFIALFGDTDYMMNGQARSFPTPTQVAGSTVPFLRQAGLSARKAEYIKGLADKFASGELNAAMLFGASDEEILEKLTAVRGLGKWSVEMFACFGLKRLDILSTGDLGVQRGMAAFKGKDVKKLKAKGGKWKYMSEQEMLQISGKFSPYRSVYMWYMWRVEDVDTNVVEQI